MEITAVPLLLEYTYLSLPRMPPLPGGGGLVRRECSYISLHPLLPNSTERGSMVPVAMQGRV